MTVTFSITARCCAGRAHWAHELPLISGLDITVVLSHWGAPTSLWGYGTSVILRSGRDGSWLPGGLGRSDELCDGCGYYSPDRNTEKPGLFGGLLAVMADLIPVYQYPNFDDVDCTPPTSGEPGILVRGAGHGMRGYCSLGFAGSAAGVTLLPDGVTILDTRADLARALRITIDPPGSADPRVKVYYGPSADTTQIGTTPIIDIPAQAELLAQQTVRLGFLSMV